MSTFEKAQWKRGKMRSWQRSMRPFKSFPMAWFLGWTWQGLRSWRTWMLWDCHVWHIFSVSYRTETTPAQWQTTVVGFWLWQTRWCNRGIAYLSLLRENLLQGVVKHQIQHGLPPGLKTDQIFILPEWFWRSWRLAPKSTCVCGFIIFLRVDAADAFMTNLFLNNLKNTCVHILGTKSG